MTTLVTTRQPLHVISMSNQPGRRASKRPTVVADFEQDDGFQFVRKSKRLKTETPEEPEPEPPRKSTRGRKSAKARESNDAVEENNAVEEPVIRTRQKAAATTTTTEATTTRATRKSSRQKASLDALIEEPPLKITKKRGPKKTAKVQEEVPQPQPESPPPPPPESEPEPEPPQEQPQTNGTSAKKTGRKAGSSKRPPPNWDESPQQAPVQSAIIALPMSDTPVINRNKEMRKKGNGSRRSSLGMRGRRASSLIDNGQAAIPHREVNPADFFKHIGADLVEPKRMRQLLTWCGERSLVEKPRHGTLNSNAIHGARAIQDQLLKDFSARPEFTNWFGRENEEAPKAPVVLKPNPRNIELDEKLAQLEINVKRLQEEKKAWQSIRKQPPEQPPLFAENETGPIVLPDFDLLDPEEGKIRGFLADEAASFDAIRSQTERRLRTIQSALEFQVDQLADNVHKLEQRVLMGSKEADKVLSISALRLRQREEREKASAGTKEMPVMEVLRSLGSILPEGG